MKRVIIHACRFFLLCLVLSGAAMAQDPIDFSPSSPRPLNEPQAETLGRLQLTASAGTPFGEALVVVATDRNDADVLLILQDDGLPLFAPPHLSATDEAQSPNNPTMRWFVEGDNVDLTGDGRADLYVQEWSGGGGCCITHYVFEAHVPSQPHQIYQGRGDPQPFLPTPGGSPPTLWVADSHRHEYRWAHAMASAWIEVPLRFIDGRFRVDTRQIKSIPDERYDLPSAKASLAEAAETHVSRAELRPDLLAPLVNLLLHRFYSGRGLEMDALIDAHWPLGLPGETDFRCRLGEEIAGIRFAPDYATLYARPLDSLVLDQDASCPAEFDNLWNP